jgi:hypothetical protein
MMNDDKVVLTDEQRAQLTADIAKIMEPGGAAEQAFKAEAQPETVAPDAPTPLSNEQIAKIWAVCEALGDHNGFAKALWQSISRAPTLPDRRQIVAVANYQAMELQMFLQMAIKSDAKIGDLKRTVKDIRAGRYNAVTPVDAPPPPAVDSGPVAEVPTPQPAVAAPSYEDETVALAEQQRQDHSREIAQNLAAGAEAI